MRTLKRNTQKMFYATFVDGGEEIYRLDDTGNPVISFIAQDGTVYYETIGVSEPHYSAPVEFRGSISFSGTGEATATEFGLNLSEYNAVMIPDGNIPINEKTLIWHESEPQIDLDGNAVADSADYSVIRCPKSLNVDKYLLQKRVK